MSDVDLLIVGAGPCGLAAAVSAQKAGLRTLVLDGGAVVSTIAHYPTYVRFFSTAEKLSIGGLPFIVPGEKPSRLDALAYYRAAVKYFAIPLRQYERVTSIERGAGGFAVHSSSRSRGDRVTHASAVVVATGYFGSPNYLRVPGEDLPHVSHYYTSPHQFYRKEVVIVGGKNSSAEAALDLFRAGAHVTIVHRGPAMGDSIKYWVKPDIDNRIKEGSVAARFNTHVREITTTHVIVESDGVRSELPADGVFLLTGYHPDADLMRKAGINVDAATLAPDLNMETFETNVPNLFIAGGAIAGKKTGNIFIENGRFHGDKIIAELTKRLRPD